jgi:phospholipase C
MESLHRFDGDLSFTLLHWNRTLIRLSFACNPRRVPLGSHRERTNTGYMRSFISVLLVELLLAGSPLASGTASAQTSPAANPPVIASTTPIKHLVVIFQENVSFDHYFGTYPHATNPQGEPAFTALPNTPDVNGLTSGLLTNNPNLNPANGAGASNPFRLDRTQASTSDQGHNYTPEQMAVHGGLMDLFPLSVGTAGPPPSAGGPPAITTKGLTMGYYDGNTVTAFWNYAQHYAMSDNSYGTTFGPSTPGAINLVSGQTNGAINILNTGSALTDGGNGSITEINDADPTGDICSTTTGTTVQFSGKNIGDLLNTAGVTWGFFSGGFNLGLVNANGTTGCNRSQTSLVTNTTKADYIPHHQPFQFYVSTANPKHTRPNGVGYVGYTDGANHQYDLGDFFLSVQAGNFPAVSFLKATGIQDGHAGYSDPIDEQAFVVQVINFLQEQSGDWANTAVVIAYDDSDGWYDHQMGPIVNQSTNPNDNLLGVGSCGDGTTALPGVGSNPHAQGRCGYGPRLPMMVISPWSKNNFVDHTVTDQTSIIRFVEDNWLNGQRIGAGSFDTLANSIANMFDFTKKQSGGKLILDQTTGEIVSDSMTAPSPKK